MSFSRPFSLFLLISQAELDNHSAEWVAICNLIVMLTHPKSC